MKNMKIKVLFALFLGGCSLGFSQIKVSPVEIYNTVVDRGYEIQEVVERLGDYYYASKDYPKAFHWYEKLKNNLTYLRYSQKKVTLLKLTLHQIALVKL